LSKRISFKYINKLAIPAIIAGIAEPLLSITDTAIVGNIKINPIESLAAVGIAGSFIAALVWIFAQTRSAISAIVAQYLGAKKLNEIKDLPAQIIVINVIISLSIYALTLFFVHFIFKLYNAEGLILNYAVDYYKIRALGFPLTLFVFSVFGVFRGMQNTFWPMVISIVGALLNVVLDFALVYGIDGFIEPMNIKGAAIASVLAQLVMAVMAFILMLKKTPFNFRFKLPFNKELRRLVNLSLNLFVRTIAFQLWLFFAFFIDGYASVGNIVSGRLLGEHNYKSLKRLSKDLMKYAITVAFILALICALFYNYIATIFTKDPLVIQTFEGVFWMVLLMQPLNALAFVFDGLFKGLAEAKTLRNTLLIATFFGFLPTLLLVDYFNLKLYGIWIAFYVWMLLRSGILMVKFKKRYLKLAEC